jgi:hypothetical protein
MLRGNNATPFVARIIIIPTVKIIKSRGCDLIALALNEGITGNLNLLTINNEMNIVRTNIRTSLKLWEKILSWKNI